jgi:lantibiotic biosynthesis protein
MSNQYSNFSKFVLRTPLLSIDFFREFTSQKTITDKQFKEILDDNTIKEAIYIASPSLINEINKWINNEKLEIKKIEKIKYSILKYISRMTGRCTPFGLFAGCTIGEIKQETILKINHFQNNKRRSRLDMNFLIGLSQDLVKIEIIKQQILFYPNTSIYNLGNQLRYIEYKYINNKRIHHIVEINNSRYLKTILKISKKGVLLKELITLLEKEGINLDRAKQFINELVDNQILISELEPSVSGIESEKQIMNVLKKINGIDDVSDILNKIMFKISEIDKKVGVDLNEYQELIEIIERLNSKFEKNYLLQTDMFLSKKEIYLNETIPKSVMKAISILNKINFKSEEDLLTKFKKKFQERYEDEEVLLSKALDSETGIPYNNETNSGDINPLIDGIQFSSSISKVVEDVKWSIFDTFFYKKILKAIKNHSYIITFTEKDFEGWVENWGDLPDTMSAIIEILIIDGKEKIKFNSIGGSSAANLLSRFCYGDDGINELVNEIINIESKINKGKILAEIIHLPESRVGNILMRPSFRDFELPYLGKSNLDNTQQLKIDDLFISVKNNQLKIRSKKYNKEIIPYLTNAHNYRYNSIPIYHFLCDFQNQEKRRGLFLNINSIFKQYDFIPRIEFENIILAEATWIILTDEIKDLIKINNCENFLLEVAIFKKVNKMPDYVILSEGDNDLVINLCNETSIRMLLNTVKNKKSFILKEYLFDKDCVVKDINGKNYSNEVILSFFNEFKYKSSQINVDLYLDEK